MGKIIADLAMEHIAAPIALFILNSIWPALYDAGEKVLLFFIILPLWIVQFLEEATDIFSGIEPIGDPEDGITVLDYFLGQSVVSRVFWGITIIAAALCIGFSIVAVIRSMGDLDVKRPVGKVLGSVGKAMLMFLVIPAICLASISLAGTVLRQTSLLIETGGGTTRPVRTTGALFMVAGTEDTMAGTPVGKWRWDADFGFFYVPGVYVTAGTDESRAVQVREGMRTYVNNGLKHNTLSRSTASAIMGLYNKYNQPASSDTKFYLQFAHQRTNADLGILGYDTLKSAYLYGNTDVTYPPGTVIYLRGSTDDNPDKVLSGTVTVSRDVGWYDFTSMQEDFNIYKMVYPGNLLVAVIASWFFVIMLCMIMMVFIKRIYELILLYLVSPFFVSVIPLDEGEKFKSWRERFVGTVIAGFGSIFMLKIFLLLLPLIWEESFTLHTNGFTNVVLKALLMCGGIFATYKSHTLISSIVSEKGASSERESAAFGLAGFSMAKGAVFALPNWGVGLAKRDLENRILGQGRHANKGNKGGGKGGNDGKGDKDGSSGNKNPNLAGGTDGEKLRPGDIDFSKPPSERGTSNLDSLLDSKFNLETEKIESKVGSIDKTTGKRILPDHAPPPPPPPPKDERDWNPFVEGSRVGGESPPPPPPAPVKHTPPDRPPPPPPKKPPDDTNKSD